jgi:fructose-1,6-bisphosphatase/inositol monophosphatase family enzyme
MRAIQTVTDIWPDLSTSLVAAVDRLWQERGRIHFWSKCADGTLVSDFDVLVDLTVRRLIERFYPGMPLVSEELGWLTSPGNSPDSCTAVLDPVDGTESLARGEPNWWVSIAICTPDSSVVGLAYQPVRAIVHDSLSPWGTMCEPTGKVGMSPDQLQLHTVAARIRDVGLEPTSAPHAVEKVAAVIEGRVDASLYLVSEKSPNWRAWDLAACLSLARGNGLTLLNLQGGAIALRDLNAKFSEPWICARDRKTFDAVRAALD